MADLNPKNPQNGAKPEPLRLVRKIVSGLKT